MVDQTKSGIHATTLQLGGYGVLIIGRSGAGKTELALTLLERAKAVDREAFFVADDRTIISRDDGRLHAHVPATLAGGVEIRGAGLFKIAYIEQTGLDLVVELVPFAQAERYPSGLQWSFEDIAIPRLLLPSVMSGSGIHSLARAVEAKLFEVPWPG